MPNSSERPALPTLLERVQQRLDAGLARTDLTPVQRRLLLDTRQTLREHEGLDTAEGLVADGFRLLLRDLAISLSRLC